MSEVHDDRPDEMPPERQEPRYGYRGDNSAWAWWWWVLGIIIIGLIIWWIVAAATPGYQRVATRPSAGGAVSAVATTVPAILASPDRYLGKAVSVRGVVGDTLGRNAFVLQPSVTGGKAAAQSLLVVGKLPIIASVKRGEQFAVTGTVIRFNTSQTGRSLGISLTGPKLQSWNNKPAIQASAITSVQQPSGTASAGGARTG